MSSERKRKDNLGEIIGVDARSKTSGENDVRSLNASENELLSGSTRRECGNRALSDGHLSIVAFGDSIGCCENEVVVVDNTGCLIGKGVAANSDGILDQNHKGELPSGRHCSTSDTFGKSFFSKSRLKEAQP